MKFNIYNGKQLLDSFEAKSMALTGDSMAIGEPDPERRAHVHGVLVKHGFNAYVERPYPSVIFIEDFPQNSPLYLEMEAPIDAFKAYVHSRLDAAGVPHDPDSPHKAEGCRIGGRLDYVFERMADIEKQRDDARKRLLTAAGDDLCRLAPEEIKAMTAGEVPIPPKEEFLASCARFHAQVASKAGVNQGCYTLAQLVAESERLRMRVEELEGL